MFRPFLPCGIAYGFAYALPMALPMLCLWLCLWHSMLFFRRKASRRVVCIVPYRRGACQPVSAEFRRHLPFSGAGGCPRVGGDCSGVAGAAGVGGALRGGACLVCRLLTLPLVFDFAPYPPDPLPRRGRGRPRLFSCKGLRPLHPRGWMGHGTGFACGKPILAASNGMLAPAGGREPGLQKAATAVHLYGRVYKCRKRFSAGVPGAKPPAK